MVKQPGTILPLQNVLTKDGVIADIGPVIKPPFDAQIIKADSFYVYAGFIDAYSNVGVARPESARASSKPALTDQGYRIRAIHPMMLLVSLLRFKPQMYIDLQTNLSQI
ncbi:MAG: hypothetical protein IPO37_22260 [Saprospiraceae bacterium]|nr:hypothetical protein [Saprospiraceae bacterium]